jgi:hypothetical protein
MGISACRFPALDKIHAPQRGGTSLERYAVSRLEKENSMTTKADITSIASKIENQVGDLPDQVRGQVEDVRRVARKWSTRARRTLREHPGKVMLGAFAVGFLLARAARHA